jgi:hypothetical protein
MRLVRSVVLALAVVAVIAPRPAEAAAYRLGVGANYWFEKSGIFDLTLAITAPVARRLSVGGRFGAALVTSPSTAALPLDLVLRGTFRRVYVEGVAGPWIFFEGDAVRAHVGLGIGLRARNISAGIELAYLDPNAILGLKVSFPL